MRSNASRSGLYDPDDGFFAKLGKYAGPVVLIGFAILAINWLIQPGAPETVTLQNKILACPTRSALGDSAVAAAKGKLAAFVTMAAARCTIISSGERVVHIENGGWFWLYAKIRYDNRIYYVDSTLL